MNARVRTPRIVPPFQPCDYELEGEAIGLALLGYPLPDWLEPRDFHGGALRACYEAVLALGSQACLPTVYAYLRDVASGPYSPPALSSVELYELMDAADHSLCMGWCVDFPRLRELSDQRRLLEAVTRVQILFEHEGTMDEARVILKGAMGE